MGLPGRDKGNGSTRRPSGGRAPLITVSTSLALALALLAASGAALADRSSSRLKHWDIDRDEWPAEPTAAKVSRMKDLRKLFKHYRNSPSTIEIRYPGGRDGRKWASEVQGWLVSLGIPVKDIAISVGAESASALRIAVHPKP